MGNSAQSSGVSLGTGGGGIFLSVLTAIVPVLAPVTAPLIAASIATCATSAVVGVGQTLAGNEGSHAEFAKTFNTIFGAYTIIGIFNGVSIRIILDEKEDNQEIDFVKWICDLTGRYIGRLTGIDLLNKQDLKMIEKLDQKLDSLVADTVICIQNKEKYRYSDLKKRWRDIESDNDAALKDKLLTALKYK